MATKYIVDNVTGQTITGDLTINGNVVITGATNTRPYKVYTALVTQTGGTDANQTSGDEFIMKGRTYYINDNPDNIDISSIGAPNNNVGTSFVATRDANGEFNFNLKLDFNAGAPTVIVLENTIGNIWFTYVDVGQYYANSNSLFTDTKTCTFFGPPYTDEFIESIITQDYTTSDLTRISFWTFHDGTTMDNYLMNNPIEIRVYN
jgi:hypothetical protein